MTSRKILICLIFLTLLSCKKNLIDNPTPQKQDDIIFAQTPKEQQTVSILKEVGTILQHVYQNPRAFYEVCAAIYSEYYKDESVLLKDLLFPETSKLYQSSKFYL